MSICIEKNILPEQSFYGIEIGDSDSWNIYYLPAVSNWKYPFCLLYNSPSSDTRNISSLHQKCNTAFCEDEPLDDFDPNVECLVSIALLL